MPRPPAFSALFVVVSCLLSIEKNRFATAWTACPGSASPRRGVSRRLHRTRAASPPMPNGGVFRTAPSPRGRRADGGRGVMMATLDYNDPVVAEEFAKVQPMDFEEVEEELLESGIPLSASINDMDAKLMLVEVRLRKQGRMPGEAKKAEKTSFSSPYEEAMYTKPVFKELIDEMKKRGDHNAVNVAVEYVNDKAMARRRYGDSYGSTLRQVEMALTAKPPVKSAVISFSGFPANMGEDACRMTLEALGDVVTFECSQSEDFPILTGKVEFGDIETAKKAVEQYDGMDMGMGNKIEMASV